MKVIEINTTNYGSTGRIALGIQEAACKKGINTQLIYGIGNKSNSDNCHKAGNDFMISMSSKLAHATGLLGCFSLFSTLRLISKMKKSKPDLIHLHNLHVSFLNLPVLFAFFKRNRIRVIWTFHDCWPFTGHCPYFEISNCDKWMTQCSNCPSYKLYPVSSFDNSYYMHKLKKRWFSNIDNLCIVTPSHWLSDLVGRSFLKNYPRYVVSNGVNLDVFYPRKHDISSQYGLNKGKKTVLGVAFDWGYRKGLDVFCQLIELLDSDLYQIVLVGTSSEIEMELPDSIIAISKTQNQVELANIYSYADVFVNPTREETFGLVNIESLACGTPVITFRTGGSAECVTSNCGAIIEKDDIECLLVEINKMCLMDKDEIESACVERAKEFDIRLMYERYIRLYQEGFV